MIATSKTSPEALPTLEERPNAEVVIFDGHCRFCRGQVEKLARWDSKGRLAFYSLHDPEVAERYPDLSHDALMQDMYVVDRRGHRHRGAEAFRYLSTKLPLLWPIAPFLHIPFSLPVWQAMYRMVARNRYRLGRVEDCGDACSVHFKK